MAVCSVCGNSYDKAFRVVRENEEYVFDSLECAIHQLAPECQHCGVKVLGHGMEHQGDIFCSAHCAREAGVKSLHDRTDNEGLRVVH